MERYNIFNLVHKGLRAALYQTALQLQQTDFTQEEETEEALNRVKEIVMLFDGHAHKEDQFVLPAIEAFEPSVVSKFEEEHKKDEELGLQLHLSIDKVSKAGSLGERIAFGRELTEAFVAFLVFNLQHMAKEEDIVNKLLWRYYSDEQIREINAQIVRNVEPWIMDFNFTWIVRGINNMEASGWMSAIKSSLPPVVFQTLVKKAEQELPKKRFIKIAQTLTEGALIA
jgi:hemerythrin-like domain-containing protein